MANEVADRPLVTCQTPNENQSSQRRELWRDQGTRMWMWVELSRMGSNQAGWVPIKNSIFDPVNMRVLVSKSRASQNNRGM